MAILEMSVIDPTGDTKIKWDPENEAEVAAARAMFAELTGKGFTAHAVSGPKGARTAGAMVREFDPKTERLIMAPPLVGG